MEEAAFFSKILWPERWGGEYVVDGNCIRPFVQQKPCGSQERQYKKNVGRTVLVTPVEGKDILGVLREVKENEIVLEVKVPKKKETVMVDIPLSDIKKIVVQIIF